MDQCSREGSGENGWILDDLLIWNTFSAFLFTVLFEYLYLRDGSRDPGRFSMGKKNVDIQEPGQVRHLMDLVLLPLT